jgi:hypothetical protein
MGDLVRRTSLGASIERRAAAPLSDGGRAIEHAMWDVPAIAFDEFAQVSHPFGDHPVVDAVSDDGLVRRRRSDRAECYFRRRVGFRAWPSGIVVVAREQPRIGSTSAPSASSRSCRRRCGGASCSGHRARGGSRGHANQAVDACLRTFQYRLLLLSWIIAYRIARRRVIDGRLNTGYVLFALLLAACTGTPLATGHPVVFVCVGVWLVLYVVTVELWRRQVRRRSTGAR